MAVTHIVKDGINWTFDEFGRLVGWFDGTTEHLLPITAEYHFNINNPTIDTITGAELVMLRAGYAIKDVTLTDILNAMVVPDYIFQKIADTVGVSKAQAIVSMKSALAAPVVGGSGGGTITRDALTGAITSIVQDGITFNFVTNSDGTAASYTGNGRTVTFAYANGLVSGWSVSAP